MYKYNVFIGKTLRASGGQWKTKLIKSYCNSRKFLSLRCMTDRLKNKSEHLFLDAVTDRQWQIDSDRPILTNMMKIQVIFFISTIVAFCQPTARFFESLTPVCPESHSRAIAWGRKCCSLDKDDRSTDNVATSTKTTDGLTDDIVASRYDYFCPTENSIFCPTGDDNCEDSSTSCDASIQLEGFGRHFDGRYSSNDPKSDIELFDNGKRVYILESSKIKSSNARCLWWYRPYRQWNLGVCASVGTDESFAYIDAEAPCPHSNEVPWRETETGKICSNTKIYRTFKTMKKDEDLDWGASFNDVTNLSATVGMTNGIVSNGVLRQFCQWRFLNHKWKCVKK